MVSGKVVSEDNVTFAEYSIVRGNVDIGKMTYIGVGSLVENYTGEETLIKIGKYCSFGPNVAIYGNSHRTAFPATGFITEASSAFNWELKCGATTIGNDVWLGAKSFIFPGIKIGHGAVIAAGAVVTKDVAPYSVVAGVPAKRIRSRFKPEIIDRLLDLCWWDWPEDMYRKHSDFFINPLDKIENIPK